MYPSEDHKSLSKLNKQGQFFIKAIIALLGINIISNLIQIPLILSSNESFLLIPIFIRIAIIATIVYFVYKKDVRVLYILAPLSLMSLSGNLRNIGQTEGIGTYFIIWNISSSLFITFASAYIIYKTKLHKSRIIDAIKNLDKKEVIFFGPAIFIVSIVGMLFTLYTFFIPPFGYHNEIPLSMYNLFKIQFSIFPIFLLISMILCVYSIIKKSFLRTYLSIILVTAFLLVSLDTYQKFVGKPYLDAVNYLAIVGVTFIIIFIVGLFILGAAIMNKYFFKLSKY